MTTETVSAFVFDAMSKAGAIDNNKNLFNIIIFTSGIILILFILFMIYEYLKNQQYYNTV